MTNLDIINQELQLIAAHNEAIAKSMEKIKKLQAKEKKKVPTGIGAQKVAERNVKLGRN